MNEQETDFAVVASDARCLEAEARREATPSTDDHSRVGEDQAVGWTAGPWHLEGDCVIAGDGRVICDVRHTGTYVAGYNARLIAAAPQLLQACEAALQDLLCVPQNLQSAKTRPLLRQASRAARGQGP